MELIEVRIGECVCPNTPHPDGDIVRLRPKLGLAAGIIIQEPVGDWLRLPKMERPGQEFMRAELAERYLTAGIAEWNLEDASGPIPINPASIRANVLDDYDRAAPAAEKADDLYADIALDPLRKLASGLSANGSTKGSISRARSNTHARRTPSKRSSTTTSPTEGTGTTTA